MESLTETTWDAIICGTGLQQSLLALALSRSGKHVLHLDPNDYYGGHEAALTLQDAEEWVARIQSSQEDDAHHREGVFSSASIHKADPSSSASTLASSRAYALSLSPSIIHTRSALLSQLVSSRAYRQLEFLAVGTFFILQSPATQDGDVAGVPSLVDIPSTREAIFATNAIQPRPKRALMKFLKFVLDHSTAENAEKWQPKANEPLADFLETDFKLNDELRTFVLALTLSLDGRITVEKGLKTIERHLSSMGVFGPGFAAVYPKFGGGGEVAQVGCRACAVGGAIYILGHGLEATRPLSLEDASGARFEADLKLGDENVALKTRLLVREAEAVDVPENGVKVSRLVAIIDDALPSLFKPTVEDTPNPGVAVIAVPVGSVQGGSGNPSTYPVFAFAHSSETGECPAGQSVLYLTTISTPTSTSVLDSALASVLSALSGENGRPQAIYKLRYEQVQAAPGPEEDGTFTFGSLPPDLALDDSSLDAVKVAWKAVMGPEATQDAEAEYMKFEDREGAEEEDDA